MKVIVIAPHLVMRVVKPLCTDSAVNGHPAIVRDEHHCMRAASSSSSAGLLPECLAEEPLVFDATTIMPEMVW